MLKKLIAYLILVTSAGATLPVVAQSATGRLHGSVTDPDGAVLVSTEVTAMAKDGAKTSVKTNQSGVYSFSGLKPGAYSISVASKGFKPFNRDVTISGGEDHVFNISLELPVQNTEVKVGDEGTLNANDPTANAGAIVIKDKGLEALSDDPDELEAQLHALAGPAAGPNGGQIYVDGFTGGQLPPKSSIREVRINQNPFSAEYDKLGYGRIEILTKPGSQIFHGRIAIEGNTSTFDSRNPFLSERPDYHSQFYYANAEGPVGKKGAFNITFERRDINDNAAINAVILDSNFNPTPFNQAVTNPKNLDMINPRLDFQLTPNNTLSGRYQWYHTREENDGVGQFALLSQAFNQEKNEHDFQLSDSQIINPRMVNDVRFEFRHDGNQQNALNSTPQITVLNSFIGGGSNQGNLLISQNHYEVHDYVSLVRGSHALKFGGRLRSTSESDTSTQNFNGTFIFSTLQSYQITQQGLLAGMTGTQIRAAGGGASQFTLVTGSPTTAETSFDGGVFFQDDWRIRTNMTVSYGLRYDLQNDIHSHGDFAPRLGVAWAPGAGKQGSGQQTVLRAGVGIFYERFPQSLILETERLNGINSQQFIVPSPDFFPNIPSTSKLAAAQIPPTVYEIDPKLVSPFIVQSAVTLEKKLPRATTISLTYLNSQGFHQLLSRNLNAPLPGTFDPQNPGSGIRPLGNLGDLYQFQSQGVFRQNQLTANFSSRPTGWLSLSGYYALTYAEADTSGASGFPSNQYNLGGDYGRAAYDIRHRVFLFGGFDFKHGIRVVPFLLASSGHPYDITVGKDLNGDGIFNDRPSFATDLARPSVVITPLGAFDTAPLPGARTIPINLGTGPPQFTLNLRFNKTFALGKIVETDAPSSKGDAGKPPGLFSGTWHPLYTLRFDVIAGNLLNYVSAALPIGDISSPLFGRSNALVGPPYSGTASNRTFHLQVQFIF